MPGKVILRLKDNSDDWGFKDVLSTFQKAEEIAGHRLDRRKNYCIIDGKVCDLHEYTASCSGCCEMGEYGLNPGYQWDKNAKCHIGAGCEECGYRGKVRNGMWIPIDGMGDL